MKTKQHQDDEQLPDGINNENIYWLCIEDFQAIQHGEEPHPTMRGHQVDPDYGIEAFGEILMHRAMNG